MAIQFQRYNGSEWVNEDPTGGGGSSSNHAGLTNLAWLLSKHESTVASVLAGFNALKEPVEYIEANYLLVDGTREMTAGLTISDANQHITLKESDESDKLWYVELNNQNFQIVETAVLEWFTIAHTTGISAFFGDINLKAGKNIKIYGATNTDYIQISFNETTNRAEITTSDIANQGIWLKTGPGADGAFVICDVDTDETTKEAKISSFPYDMDEDHVSVYAIRNTLTANEIFIGGNSASHQAATVIAFYTANVIDTVAGTKRFEIEGDGTLNVGSTSNYEALVTGDDDIPNRKFITDYVGAHYPKYHMYGLNTRSTSGDELDSVDIAVGECMSDDHTTLIELTSLQTIDVTTSGANGLDTGSASASTDYYIWLIYNPTSDTTAGLFSTSVTSPTLPSGYTKKRLIGFVRRHGASDFGWFHTTGTGCTKEWIYSRQNYFILSAGAATSYTAVNLEGGFVPDVSAWPKGLITVKISIEYSSKAVLIRNGWMTGSNHTLFLGVTTSGTSQYSALLETDNNGDIEYYGSGGSASVYMKFIGWTMEL